MEKHTPSTGNEGKKSKLTHYLFTAYRYISYLYMLANLAQHFYWSIHILLLLNNKSICAVDGDSGVYFRLQHECNYGDTILGITSQNHLIFSNTTCMPEAVQQINSTLLSCSNYNHDTNTDRGFPFGASRFTSLISHYKPVGVLNPYAGILFILNSIALTPMFLASMYIKSAIKPFLQRQAVTTPKFTTSPGQFLARAALITILENILLAIYTHGLMILSWSTIRNFEHEIRPGLYELQPACGGEYVMCTTITRLLYLSSILTIMPFYLLATTTIFHAISKSQYTQKVLLFLSNLLKKSLLALKKCLSNLKKPLTFIISWFILQPFFHFIYFLGVFTSWPKMWAQHHTYLPTSKRRNQCRIKIKLPITSNKYLSSAKRHAHQVLRKINADVGRSRKWFLIAYLIGVGINSVISVAAYSISYLVNGQWKDFSQLELSRFNDFIHLNWTQEVFQDTSALSIYLSYSLTFLLNITQRIAYTIESCYASTSQTAMRR